MNSANRPLERNPRKKAPRCSSTNMLQHSPSLKPVLTSNDFLLTADDLAWFRGKFGERVIYSEKGGHMGHIWKPEVKAKMREAIRWKIN